METVINNLNKNRIKGRESSLDYTSETVSNRKLPALDKLENIGFYTLSDYRVKRTSITSPIWRCEILLTTECNFTCPYCKHTKKSVANIEDVKLSISNLIYYHKLKNIRFSGGEPTLFKGLKDLIMFSKNKNIERVAISTNGSASLKFYKELIDCGVNDYSISLDACCGSDAETMGCKKNMWKKVIKNIEELSKLTYVTVGVVLNEKNISKTQQIIKFAYNLRVSDIRIISSSQYNKPVTQLISIDAKILAKYPILNYRVNNFLRGKTMRGLSEHDSDRCPLVLDDLLIRDGKHYPCVIYAREGGQHIGYMSEEIRYSRYDWFKKHDTQKDIICKNNCLDVCKDYNNRFLQFNAVDKGSSLLYGTQ